MGFVRRAVYARWRRQFGWTERLAVGACLGLALLMVRDGRTGWFTAGLACLAGLIVLLWLGMGWAYRVALREESLHSADQVLVESRDDALVVRHGENVVAMTWERLKKIERRQDHWLLFWSLFPENFNVLPTATLPPEMLDHVLDRARAAGAKVA